MPSHFVFAAMTLWGHLRPQLALALNLLDSYPNLYITFLTHVSTIEKIRGEIESFDASKPVQARLKIATVGTTDPGGSKPPMVELNEQVPHYFETQLKNWAIGGTGFNARPTFVSADHFLITAITGWKSACKEAHILPAIPFFTFVPTNLSFHMLYFAPGGIVDTMLKKAAQFKFEDPARSQDHLALLDKAFQHTDGRLINQIGCEPIHDYENIPQLDAAPLPPNMGNLLATFERNDRQSDGVIVSFSPDLEPKGLGKKAEEVLSRRFFQPGPQISPKVWAGDFSAGTFSPSEQAALEFLDASEIKYGKKSVLYISFGSIFFPSKRPDLIFTFLESLVSAEPPIPFLFATGGASPELAKEFGEWVATTASGIGMVSSWTPQMKVLDHSATGWFLTHGGSNSTTEALLAAVPMIFWPVTADQPVIASRLTIDLKISVELMQVRTGPSVGKPTYRGITPLGTKEALTAELTELWKMLRGPYGTELRQRLRSTIKIMKESRESGAAKEGMRRFEEFMS